MLPTAQSVPPASAPRRDAVAPILALVWGLAEATVFFVLPDTWISRVALGDFRRALRLSLLALVGALLGATILWTLAHSDHDRTQILLNTADRLPGISRDHIVRSAQALHGHGVAAAGIGAILGQPYKLFAVHAGAQDLALLPFLAASAAGIALRLLATSAFFALLSRVLCQQAPGFVYRLHAWIWIGLYLVYFALNR